MLPPPFSFERRFKFAKHLELSKEKEAIYNQIQEQNEKQRLIEEEENKANNQNLHDSQQLDEDDYWSKFNFI